MRTTIDFPEELLRALKARAAHEGRSLSELVTDAARAFALREPGAGYQVGHSAVPISQYAGGGLVPGIDLTNSAELLDYLEADLPRDKRR